jgi:hypothetical protein
MRVHRLRGDGGTDQDGLAVTAPVRRRLASKQPRHRTHFRSAPLRALPPSVGAWIGLRPHYFLRPLRLPRLLRDFFAFFFFVAMVRFLFLPLSRTAYCLPSERTHLGKARSRRFSGALTRCALTLVLPVRRDARCAELAQDLGRLTGPLLDVVEHPTGDVFAAAPSLAPLAHRHADDEATSKRFPSARVRFQAAAGRYLGPKRCQIRGTSRAKLRIL